MNTKLITAGALSGLVFASGFAGLVSAQSAAEATGLTEEQIIEIALTEIPGEVLEIEQDREGGVEVYEVEIMDEAGDEFELILVADTGEILEVEEDDHDGRRGGKDCDDDRDDDNADDGAEPEDA